MRKIYLLLLLTGCTGPTEPSLRTEVEAKELCGSAAKSIANGNVDAAFATLSPHWPSESKSTKYLMPAGDPEYLSSPTSAEFVEAERVAGVTANFRYLLKFQKGSRVFECFFLHQEDGWKLATTNWSRR